MKNLGFFNLKRNVCQNTRVAYQIGLSPDTFNPYIPNTVNWSAFYPFAKSLYFDMSSDIFNLTHNSWLKTVSVVRRPREVLIERYYLRNIKQVFFVGVRYHTDVTSTPIITFPIVLNSLIQQRHNHKTKNSAAVLEDPNLILINNFIRDHQKGYKRISLHEAFYVFCYANDLVNRMDIETTLNQLKEMWMNGWTSIPDGVENLEQLINSRHILNLTGHIDSIDPWTLSGISEEWQPLESVLFSFPHTGFMDGRIDFPITDRTLINPDELRCIVDDVSNVPLTDISFTITVPKFVSHISECQILWTQQFDRYGVFNKHICYEMSIVHYLVDYYVKHFRTSNGGRITLQKTVLDEIFISFEDLSKRHLGSVYIDIVTMSLVSSSLSLTTQEYERDINFWL